jgi:hypothetical protein
MSESMNQRTIIPQEFIPSVQIPHSHEMAGQKMAAAECPLPFSLSRSYTHFLWITLWDCPLFVQRTLAGHPFSGAAQ